MCTACTRQMEVRGKREVWKFTEDIASWQKNTVRKDFLKNESSYVVDVYGLFLKTKDVI